MRAQQGAATALAPAKVHRAAATQGAGATAATAVFNPREHSAAKGKTLRVCEAPRLTKEHAIEIRGAAWQPRGAAGYFERIANVPAMLEKYPPPVSRAAVLNSVDEAYTSVDASQPAGTGPDTARNIRVLELGVARSRRGAGADSVLPHVGRSLPGDAALGQIAATIGQPTQCVARRVDLDAAQHRKFRLVVGVDRRPIPKPPRWLLMLDQASSEAPPPKFSRRTEAVPM